MLFILNVIILFLSFYKCCVMGHTGVSSAMEVEDASRSLTLNAFSRLDLL